MAKKKGRGWHGQSKRHSVAAKKGAKRNPRAGTGHTGQGAKVKKWLNDEIGRSKGARLSDFSRSQRKALYKTYGMMRKSSGTRSIRGAVNKWSGF